VKRGALAILQLQSELYQLALHTASRELAYQRVAEYHGRFEELRLEHPVCIQSLLSALGEIVTQDGPSDLSPEDASQVLEGQAGVLQQEFGMEVAGGRLHSLPDVMGGALPRPRGLPRLLLALAGAFGGDGSLDAHKACQAFAAFFAVPPDSSDAELQVVLSLMKRRFHPSQTLLDGGALCKLTDLKKLYTVFERC